MAWEKAADETVRAFRDVAPGGPEAEERKMFGFPCSFVHGNMFMGLHQDSFILRLNPQDRAFAIASGAATFAPMGRTMKEYVQLPPAILADEAQLREWVARSYAFASAMPTKEKKARANAKKTAP